MSSFGFNNMYYLYNTIEYRMLLGHRSHLLLAPQCSFSLHFSPLLPRTSNQTSLSKEHHISLDFVSPEVVTLAAIKS